MAELWYNQSGTWRKAKELWYLDGSTWRKCKELWFNQAGTWRKVFSGFAVNPSFGGDLNNTSFSLGVRTATLTLKTDGTATAVGGISSLTSANWGLPTTASIGANYWVRFSLVSATNVATTGAALNTWVSLSADVALSVKNTASSVEGVGSLTLEFSTDASGSTIVATLTNAFSISVGYVV